MTKVSPGQGAYNPPGRIFGTKKEPPVGGEVVGTRYMSVALVSGCPFTSPSVGEKTKGTHAQQDEGGGFGDGYARMKCVKPVQFSNARAGSITLIIPILHEFRSEPLGSCRDDVRGKYQLVVKTAGFNNSVRRCRRVAVRT